MTSAPRRHLHPCLPFCAVVYNSPKARQALKYPAQLRIKSRSELGVVLGDYEAETLVVYDVVEWTPDDLAFIALLSARHKSHAQMRRITYHQVLQKLRGAHHDYLQTCPRTLTRQWPSLISRSQQQRLANVMGGLCFLLKLVLSPNTVTFSVDRLSVF